MNRYALLLAAAFALPATGQTVQQTDGPEAVSLTIYNDDLALIREQRQVSLERGRQTVEFKGVSGRIIPESAILSADGVLLLEQNFDFDLLSPNSLIEKSVGQTVRVYRINPATGEEQVEQATILAVNNGVILQVGERIEILQQGHLPGRLVFDAVPDKLRARPTLSTVLTAEQAGPQRVDLSYLSKGLGWHADYVAVLNAEETELSLQGLITLTNTSGTAFTDAQLQLVAGEVNRAPTPQPRRAADRNMAGVEMMRLTGTEAREEALLDYHLYTLPERTTLADRQTKQVGLLSAETVGVRKLYRSEWFGFRSRPEPRNARVFLDFENEADNGLGRPMPGGVFRVYTADSGGRLQFVGEDRIDHTAEGQEIELTLGEAFDVTVKAVLDDRDQISRGRNNNVYEVTQTYVLANAKDSDVTVDLTQRVPNEFKILSESIPSSQPDARTLTWSVPVSAKGETELTFTLRVGQN